MNDEEWANESNENKLSWNNMNLHKVLKRGPNFRFTTQSLSQNDKDMAINRAIIYMSASIRKTLKARVIGEQLTKAREWEVSKGLKVKAHKFHVTPQPKKLDKLENELKQQYAVEIPHAGPQRDERNKVIKGKKLVLKNCAKHLKNFRDDWELVGLPPPQLAQLEGSEEYDHEEEEEDSMSMLPKKAREKKRKRGGRTIKEHYSNISVLELEQLKFLSARKEEFRIERADKGGAIVVISAKRMNQEAREHITKDKANEKALFFREKLGISKTYEGGNKDTTWQSTLSILPVEVENPNGLWSDKREVINSLYERMEYFLCVIHKGKLPTSILANLLARGYEDYDKGTFTNPRMAQKPGEKWGLGPPLVERRNTSRLSPLEAIIKLHKVEICSRPVARAYSSQMKEWEQFMAGVLNQVMEEIEEYRVRQKKQRIVLNSSLPYARRIDEINEEWQEAYRKGERKGLGVEVIGFDVTAMYPNLKIAYIIKEIDRAMLLRIDLKDSVSDKQKAEELMKIIIPMIIFMLEHQFVIVGVEGGGEKGGEREIFRQGEGIGIGSSCSGTLANLTLLMGEIDMLDKLEREGIYLSLYNRYMDDISIIADMINKEDKGRLFMRLKTELENLDPVGKSIQVTGKELFAHNRVETWDGTEEQGLEYLDIWQGLKRDPQGQVRIECSIYRKTASADMYILPSSAHSKKLRLGVIRGEFLRYLTLCSTEEGYNEACERLRKALETRGYKKSEIQGEKDRILWSSKQEVLKKREEGGKNSAKNKAGPPGIPVVVPDKQGLREWWQQCTRQGVTQSFGEYFTNAEVEMLPSRMFRCLSRTESMGDFVKRNRKKE